MSTTTAARVVVDDGAMSASHPRAGGPRPRRTSTPTRKMVHLQAHEAACAHGDGGGYLRRQGSYSSLLSEWRRARDAGRLSVTGEYPIGRLSAEQAEIATLERELQATRAKLPTTESALTSTGPRTTPADMVVTRPGTVVR